MLESLRKQSRALPDISGRASLDAALLRRAARAVIAGVAVLALLHLALEVRVFSGLPGYPAAFLVLLGMLVVPGLLLREALLPCSHADVIERLTLAFPLGIAIAAPAGLLALSLNLSLDTFLRLHIVIASLIAAGSAFLAPPGGRAWLSSTLKGWNSATLALLLLLAVAVGGILSSPSWGGDRLARNFDDWRYMTYVNSYLHRDHIEPLHPVGIGEAAYPRMEINTWVVFQAGVARAAGVSAESVVMDDLTPILIVFALLATYTLAKGLLRSRAIALLAVAIQLGYALIDMSHDEGLGANFLFRMSQDKMVATYILFPIGLLFVSRFLRQTQASAFAIFALICLALFVVHPQPLLFLGIALLALALLQAAAKHSWRPLLWSATLGVPLAAFTFGQFIVWHLFNTSWPALFDTSLTWRETFKIVHLPGGMIMGNYHLIEHPLLLGALIVAPLVWWPARRSLPQQLLLAVTIGWLPWFFIPPLTTIAAKLASAELTARLQFMTPVAVVWAYAAYHGLRLLRRRWRGAMSTVWFAAPAATAVLVLGGGLLFQELYYPVDHGAYYTWSSTATTVPGTERSIFLGGKDRLLSHEWRISPDERELLHYLQTHTPEGASVLAPDDINLHLPGTLWQVRPVFSQGILGQWERPLVMGLYQGRLRGNALQAALDQSQVQYVITRGVSDANAALIELPTAYQLIGIGPYDLYAIQR